MSAKPLSRGEAARRSPCPVACGLDMFGDRWTLLVIRDMMLGKRRFKEFAASPEGVPTNILAERLARLEEAGLVMREPVEPGARHQAYRLTPKGQALRPVLAAMRDWGLRWVPGTAAAVGARSQASSARPSSRPGTGRL